MNINRHRKAAAGTLCATLENQNMKKLDKFVITGLIILTCLSSCCKTGQNKLPDIYVISSLTKSNSEHFTLPTHEFGEKQLYQHYNFIIDSADNLFYYSIPHIFEGRIAPGPVFANLHPDRLIQIPKQSVIDFIKQNVTNTKQNNIVISIASQKDTINSYCFSEMNRFLCDSTEGVKYYVRRTTIEENIVLSYKKKCKFYDPTCIKWDSTKTIFIKPPLEVNEKFVPPTVVKNK